MSSQYVALEDEMEGHTHEDLGSNKSMAGEDSIDRFVRHDLKIGSGVRTWAEISKINYLSSDNLVRSALSTKKKSIIGFPKDISTEKFRPIILKETNEDNIFSSERFPVNISTLMNESNYWGCFYVFPELYRDEYSPTVLIRKVSDALPIVDGVLTRNLVSTCLSYPKRVPILGDFVYIKLDLSMLYLTNIAVLQHYKFLVYLDLSNNYLTNISVLSFLLYLQYLSVSFNQLESLLEYEPPQWFLTEVHYKFNVLREIRDISIFWSITILDLSNNFIKEINGLQNLRFLRTLDLSFNHIQKLENLNNLPLVWIDLSYNNISTFEFNINKGLWTLLHLEYLNLNENSLTTLKMFSGCCRIRELHIRNNNFCSLVELAIYMRKMRRLTVLDLRANPICGECGFREAVINTFPILLQLNAAELNPVEQRSKKMKMNPDVIAFATRRLQRLLFVEQMRRVKVSSYIPPADTQEVPLVVLVGLQAVGKYTLACRLAEECKDHVNLARLHTSAKYQNFENYIQISSERFDEMLMNGDFLTYCEKNGESYGLSREQGMIKDGKITVVCMDLISALMLKLRGRRPYLILITVKDRSALAFRQRRQKKKNEIWLTVNTWVYTVTQGVVHNEPPISIMLLVFLSSRNMAIEEWLKPKDGANTTVQPIPSGRILIAGILNEIIMMFPDTGNAGSQFVFSPDCSLMNEAVVNMFDTCITEASRINHPVNSRETIQPETDGIKTEDADTIENKTKRISYDENIANGDGESVVSLTSLFKDAQPGGDRQSLRTADAKIQQDQRKISDNTADSFKVLSTIRESVKSVTFVRANGVQTTVTTMEAPHASATLNEQRTSALSGDYIPSSMQDFLKNSPDQPQLQETDLWHIFLHENGLFASGTDPHHKCDSNFLEKVLSKLEVMSETGLIKYIDFYHKLASESVSVKSKLRQDYETVHRNRPGLFWDTVYVDNPERGLAKTKRIVKEIVRSQNLLQPMFDINFTSLNGYTNVQQKLEKIKKEIAPRRTFF